MKELKKELTEEELKEILDYQDFYFGDCIITVKRQGYVSLQIGNQKRIYNTSIWRNLVHKVELQISQFEKENQ